MRSGKIESVFKPGVISEKEGHVVQPFFGWPDLLRRIYRAYRSKAYKTYIFFDEPKK